LGENAWVTEADGIKSRDRPKKTLSVVVEKDCPTRQLIREDAMDRSKWRRN